MRLIAIRPTEDNETYHQWFLSDKGYISRTITRNIQGMRTMMMTAKADGIRIFSLTESSVGITVRLKKEQELKGTA